MKENKLQLYPYLLSDIFEIRVARSRDLGSLAAGTIPFVGRTNLNNGIQSYVDSATVTKRNCISISMVGTNVAFWQDRDFVASQNIATLRNQRLTSKSALYVCTILNFEMQKKFSYGRTVSKKILDSMEIKLPQKNNLPDWDSMEKFIESLNSKPITTKINSGTSSTISTNSWKDFKLKNLFEVKKGKRLRSEDREEGGTIYVGAIDSNNGVSDYISHAPIHEGNTISLSYNGSIAEAFYQPDPFWATDDVNVLYFKKDNKVEFNQYIALFICAILKREKYRFSYGRKWVLSSMEETIIKLPTTQYGNPDWKWMENYIKSLPYGDRI